MPDERRVHPETGQTLRRDIRPVTVRYGGRERVVDLPGWYPSDEGDGIVSATDMKAMDRALNRLKAEIEGLLTPMAVRRIRQRLRLSQRKAGELLGGGPRAFQKYESGDIVVSRPMANLLRLLEQDPSRLNELEPPER